MQFGKVHRRFNFYIVSSTKACISPASKVIRHRLTQDIACQFHFQILIPGQRIHQTCRRPEQILNGQDVHIAFRQYQSVVVNKKRVKQVGLGMQYIPPGSVTQ